MAGHFNPSLNHWINSPQGALAFNIANLSKPLALYLSSPKATSVLLSGAQALNGQGVDTWNSIAGIGAFTQATGGSQPLCETGIQNGLQIVRFDGSAKTMTGNTATKSLLSSKPGCTVVMAIGWTGYNSGGVSTPFGFTTTSGNSKVNCQAGAGTTTANRGMACRANAGESSSTMNTASSFGTGWAVETFEVDFANKQGRIRRNGVTQAGWTTLSNMTAGNAEAGASSAVYLGAFGAGGFANADLQLLLCYPGILTATELTGVERFVGGISGITVA